MKDNSYTRTGQILKVMRILVWVAFVGFMFKAGAYLVSFGISCINPEASKHMYKAFDLSRLQQFGFTYYFSYVSFIVALLVMKAFVCYIVIKNLSGLTLTNPFQIEVAESIEKISYILFGAWIVGLISNGYSAWLLKRTGEVFETGASDELLFMAGLVFIISQVFKRGVEIQSENELTV